MKKRLALLMAMVLFCSLTACTGKPEQPADSSTSTTTTTSPSTQQEVNYSLFYGAYSDSEQVEGPCYTVEIIHVDNATRAIELSISYVGYNTSPIYTTDTIHATIAKDHTVRFEWEDSWENQGVGTLLLNPDDPSSVQLMMTVTEEALVNRATLATNGEYKTFMRRGMVEVYEKNGVLRIESIQPGLDTYYLAVTLRSMADGQNLSSVVLGEGDWETGWLTDGFYAISLDKRLAYLYDMAGQCVKKISLPQDIENLSLAMLNEAGDTLLLGKGETAELLLYDPETQATKAVAPTNGGVRTLTYEDGSFYVSRAEFGELMCIGETDAYATVPYCSQEILFMFPTLGIGKTETNFSVYIANEDAARYVSFRAVDEIPLAADKHSFITVASAGDEDVLTLYDLKNRTVGTLTVPAQVMSALYTDDGNLLITTRASGSGVYAFQPYTTSQFQKEELTVSLVDTPPSATLPSEPGESTGTAKAQILSVPVLSQWPEYPTGCESVSAVMALRYAGEDITVAKFIDTYLPKSNEFYFQDGIKYGPDPYQVFIGSPRTSAAYGCMAPVIETALTAYFGSSQRVVNTTGSSLADLCSTYIDNDKPVLVWATIQMQDTYPSASWYLADGSRFSWPANEHCLVLVGYDESQYYFNDPYVGRVVAYEKTLCNTRYEVMGKQSIVIQ